MQNLRNDGGKPEIEQVQITQAVDPKMLAFIQKLLANSQL